MTRRIILGKDSGGTYCLKVSKEGQDAFSASGSNLLFDSTSNSGKGRYFQAMYARIMGTSVNHSFGARGDVGSGRSYTTGGTEYHYLPLGLVMEDASGTFLDHQSTNGGATNYYSMSSSYKSYMGVQNASLISENFKVTGVIHATTHSYNSSTNADDNISSGTYAIRSYNFAPGSSDFGTNFTQFNPSSSDNDTWDTNGNTTISGTYITKRLKFRNASTGASLNSTFFREKDGGITTVSTANSGGLPIANAQGAIYPIPCGYGYMTPEFMGFNP